MAVADWNQDNNAVVHSVDTYHSPDYNVAAVPEHTAGAPYTQHYLRQLHVKMHSH